MDLKSLFCLSPCRLILGLACAWMLSAESHAQPILFHETFDVDAIGEYAFDSNTPFAAQNPGNSYWGVWDENGDTDDFGSSNTPDFPKVPNYVSDGNILIGRNMDHPSVSATPGFISKSGISVGQAPVHLTVAISLAANNGGDGGYETQDFIRVFVRESGDAWGDPIIDLTGVELEDLLTLSFTEFTADFVSLEGTVDLKMEMVCDEGDERIAADNLLLIRCQDADDDGICDDVDDCVGTLDACGVCNGPGAIYECGCAPLPEGYCDCANSPVDVIGECGGDCAADADSDGVCDDEDDCVGELDECGVCNGPGEIYDCGCSEVPEGDCDCDGVQLDALGICGGLCESDADADGVCDDVDPCVGELDACGVCNGPGEVYECGCADIPEGDCDCSGTESEEVIVTIIPDNYGSDITWVIQDAEDNVVLSGGSYTNSNTNAIVVSAPLCPACYTFTIYDSYGDGLLGGGNYSITAGGQTLIQGTGDYGTSESSGFCIEGNQDCAVTGSYSGDLAGLDFGSEILLPLSLNASIDSVEFALDFDGPGNDYWASDMAIVLTNPAGQCVTLEGAWTTMLPTCSPNGYEFWPSSWDSSVDGTYVYTYSGGLIGEVLGTAPGDWTIEVVNAWGGATARVSYDLTWTVYLNCSGCTNPDACNYDDAAIIDDGSCINPDPSLGCCETLGDVCVSLEGGSQSEPFQFAAAGTLETLELELGWANSVGSGGTANYPGAFSMVIESPNGVCVHFGEGSGAFAPAGCLDAGGYTVYGSGWGDPSGAFGNTAVVLESTLDLSEFGLAGNGAWNITLGNGVPASDAVSYSVNWALDYLCPLEGAYLGCLDPLACNYSSESTIDDGSCDYLSCGCSVSGSQLDTLSFDNWAGQTEQVEVGTNPDPTLFFVDLNFTNVSADGNGEEDPSSFASDMLVTVIDAGGNCTWWGGFNWYGAAGISAPPGCEPSDELAGASWDACWDISESGQYSDAIDLSSAGLSGAGTWEVTVYNGWSWIVNECPPGSCLTQHYGDAIYDVEWALIGACSGYGCTDEAACNYDEAATIDDGSCAELDDCGVCDGDGSSCSGCTDEYACNYDPLAIIDDGSCDVVIDTIVGCCTYSDTAVAVTLGGAGNEEVWTVLATSIGGLGEFELTIDFAPSGSMINWASDVLVSFIDPNGLCYYFGGNQFTEEGGLSPYIADNNCEPVSSGWPSSWDTNVAGVYSAVVDLSETDLTGNGEWEVAIHNGDIQSSPASYSLVTWEVAGLCEVEACSDPTACNYTPNWTAENNALCVYPGFCESCNPDGTTSYEDADADGICDDEDGCSDVTADNFEDPEAALCIYYGCMNAAATNYDPGANVDDESCILLGCLDGDPVSIDGTPPACNYDPQANTDDGSCEYTSCAGCMDGGGEDGIVACNYDPLALIDDGSCDYSCQEGCMELTACNYDASVTIENGSCEYADGVCEYCSGETDGSGTVLGGDTDGDGVCNQDEVPGCTDEAACNYNASATDDDGSCEVPSLPCEECLGSYLVNFDTDGDGVCNGDEVVGCMDELACNYDDAATDDSGCIYAVAPCEVCSGGAADGTGAVVDSETVPELPDAVVVTTGSMTANPGGYVLIEDASSAYDAVEDPCGRLTYTFGSEDCPDLASVSVLPAGVHELYVTVSNGLTSTAPIPTIITVEVE
ncbi:MAG: hypothetical protein L7S67_00975, partial [Flavobacteriales bacterium]|nr:hypothetical protein [Flavobacteriales bacterium]